MTTLPCPLPQVEEALRPYIHDRQETLRIRKLLAHHLQSQIHRVHAHHHQHQHQQQQHGPESTLPSITPLTLAAAPPFLLPESQSAASSLSPPPAPPELTGLRKRYWEAVQAHHLAKNRRDALHGELNELQRESQLRRATAITSAAAPAPGAPVDLHSSFPTSIGSEPAGGAYDAQNYVALLRQRRRHAGLQILLDALDRVADAEPNPLLLLQGDDLRQWVKDRLGDAPVPPPEIAGGGVGGSGEATSASVSATGATAAAAPAASASEDQVRDLVLRLKKELLHAKQSLDAEKEGKERAAAAAETSGRDVADVVTTSSVEAQVGALRAARDELIAWIEAELAKMPEGDESVLSSIGASPQRQHQQQQHGDRADAGASDDEDVPVQDRVESLYDRYVTARASLVSAVDAAASAAKQLATISTLPPAAAAAAAPSEQPADANVPGEVKLPPSAVLPFVPSLLRAVADERALVQQSTHLRHAVAARQEDARRAMQRLASESQLVGPEAEGAMAWARAAGEVEREADGAVMGCVREGAARVEGAKAILAELDERRKVFREVRGKA